MKDLLAEYHTRSWAWFQQHARSPHALAWLAFIAFIDPIFFPIAPEVFIVVLVLAHREHAKKYFTVAFACSAIGAAAGYFITFFLFTQFGEPLVALYGLQDTFIMAKHYLSAQVFLAMLLVSFTPIPDKVFIWASGVLGVPFFPFFAGYVIGRGARMALVSYVTHRFGTRFLDLVNRYMLWFSVGIVALGTIYVMVHWHLFGL
ncbi:MAG: hypothetical protein Q7R71_00810 [bacterium]|nr:hypothetical protein [bacterium]